MKILYAEDEEVLRQLMVMRIEGEMNLKVLEAGSGFDAIEVLKKDENKEIHLVITDYSMPNGTGGDLYAWIRLHRPEIPVIVTSALEMDDKPEFDGFSEHHKLNQYYLKPFDFEDLERVISKVKIHLSFLK